ncbi:MAG: FAD-dependent oxidoreductase, partial [Terracidiphilus sp.]
IATPLRDLLRRHRNVEFLIADVTGIDAGRRRVLARRPLGEQIELGYDYLILAAGMRQSYFGHEEYARFAPGMKTIEDAMKIRRRVFGAFELAESAGDPAERRRWLTFALVGAGPTGVELAGQIREVATKTGLLGWWAWLFIHIAFLTGYRNRVGAVLGWWFAFTRDVRRERTYTTDDTPATTARDASTGPPDSPPVAPAAREGGRARIKGGGSG